MRGLKKNHMGRGQTDEETITQTHRHTDSVTTRPTGPRGRVGENHLRCLTQVKSAKTIQKAAISPDILNNKLNTILTQVVCTEKIFN